MPRSLREREFAEHVHAAATSQHHGEQGDDGCGDALRDTEAQLRVKEMFKHAATPAHCRAPSFDLLPEGALYPPCARPARRRA